MAYRDEMERCPRCGVDLTDAVVGAACNNCRGLWIAPGSVQEMAMNMQTPPDLLQLPFAEDSNREQLPCPTCREGMLLRSLYQVPIDVCEKHGIWFDANELAAVLMRAVRKP
jgi:Zn-finger nucleic acid-binding protein